MNPLIAWTSITTGGLAWSAPEATASASWFTARTSTKHVIYAEFATPHVRVVGDLDGDRCHDLIGTDGESKNAVMYFNRAR